MTEHIFPVKVIKTEGNVKNAASLLKKKDLLIGFFEKNQAIVSGEAAIMLDFGKEYCGSVRIITTAGEGACKNKCVRIRLGESVSETMSAPLNYSDDMIENTTATNDHAVRDFKTYLPFMSDMTFNQSGFRFLRIDFPAGSKFYVKAIVIEAETFVKKQIYAYTGSDERVRDIFETAKRTVTLCVQNNYVWDGIKRDRLVWMGDMHPEMLALTTLYGSVKQFENSLDYHKRATPKNGWMNTMPTYSVWYLAILSDYYEATKNARFIKKHLLYSHKVVAQCLNCIDESGETHYPDYFLDWPTRAFDDRIDGCRALNIYAFKKLKKLYEVFGEDCSHVDEMLARLNKIPMKENLKFKQVVAMKYLATGKITDSEKAFLVKGGAKGLSTFMSYYILKAIADTSGKQAAIDIMKEYYGKMLDLGATTFFEDFNVDWAIEAGRIDELPDPEKVDFHKTYGEYCYKGYRHSFCHGWSSGVIKFIKEYCE